MEQPSLLSGVPSNVTSSSIVEKMFLVVYTFNKARPRNQTPLTTSLFLSLFKQRSRLSISSPIHYFPKVARFQKRTKGFLLINLACSERVEGNLTTLLFCIFIWFLQIVEEFHRWFQNMFHFQLEIKKVLDIDLWIQKYERIVVSSKKTHS